MKKPRIADIRTEYRFAGITEADLHRDPFVQFERWLADALREDPRRANAMTLATATKDCTPSARTVLLKEFDKRGFVFFTNGNSRKGRALKENPYAALVFYWTGKEERQVRIEGSVKKVSRAESLRYFRSRPRESQLGAWASQQSRVLKSREELEARVASLATQYAGRPVPLPPYWGGYRLSPVRFQFLQTRENRLHDLFLYERTGRKWKRSRLFP